MKIKIPLGDAEHEVDLTEHLPEGAQILTKGQKPEGYVTTEFMQTEIERRVKGAKSGLTRKEELLADETFRREFAQQLGVALDDEGKPVKASDVDVKALHQQWEAQHVRPLQHQIEQAGEARTKVEEQNRALIRSMVASELERASEELGMEAWTRTRTGPNSLSAVAQMFIDQFDLNPTTGNIAVKRADGEGFEYGPNPEERVDMSAKDRLRSLMANPAFRPWFGAAEAKPTGLGQTGGALSGAYPKSRAEFSTSQKLKWADEQRKLGNDPKTEWSKLAA